MIERPNETEFAPFYAGYISKVPEGDVLELLREQKDRILRLAEAAGPEQEVFRYAPGKWSVREVFGHLTDAERVFGYRAFRFGRADETPLSGFDENHYIAHSAYHSRPLASLAEELALARAINLVTFEHLAAEDWLRTGTANGFPVSVRALAFILVGHMSHHLGILRERYGVATTD